MRVFIDTNIFAEYIFERGLSTSVQRIFQAIEEKRIDAVTSSASTYTMVYISEQMLKRKGIHQPELTKPMCTEKWLQLLDYNQHQGFRRYKPRFDEDCFAKRFCERLFNLKP